MVGLLTACQSSSPSDKASAAQANPGATPPGAPELPARVSMTVDWVTMDGLDGTMSETGMVVHGRVVQQRSANRRVYPYDEAKGRRMTPEEAGNVFLEVPRTVSTVRVDQMVFAPDATAAALAEVDIEQLGGTGANGVLYEADDNPILRMNEEGVFMLSATHRPAEA